MEVNRGTWPKALYLIPLHLRVVGRDIVVRVPLLKNKSRERFKNGEFSEAQMANFMNRLTRLVNLRMAALMEFLEQNARDYEPPIPGENGAASE